MRRFAVVASTLALALSAPAAALAQAAPLSVSIDHATRVQMRGAVASVIVANPDIADVTVVDANTLYITGKGYGVTEIVAVDAIGRTLFQNEVVVTAPNRGHVRVWRGAQATEMACGASCSPSVRAAPAAAPVAP